MAETRTTPLAKTTKAPRRTRRPKLSDEAEALLKDANDASSGARNAWLAFLALITYLLVTLGGVSHRDLLLNSPVKLPIINVELPLFSFFQYAPVLLLLVLLSLLIQHVMLARKYRAFVEVIASYEKKSSKEHPARELVHPYVVSQRLAGPKRNLITRSLMRVIGFVTFALLPILTLLYFQVKFIPYHEVWVTYWHRIMVLLGLGLLIALLPIIQLKPREEGVALGPKNERWRVSRLGIALGALTTIFVVSFSWLIATIPNEGLDQLTEFMEDEDFTGPRDTRKLVNPLMRFVYQSTPQADEGMNGWLLPWLISHRVLIVEDEDLVPDKDDEHNEVSVVLRDRNLQFARLNRSDLHRADLTGANLYRAEMEEISLEHAKLEGAELQEADLSKAKLRGAYLTGAKLQGAYLDEAELRDSKLKEAKLQDAYLSEAKLQKADAGQADLQGANLSYAQLQGADLSFAKLHGADLNSAQLQSTDLSDAKLQGADLSFAELQGADLNSAQLQGADLSFAELQGVNLSSAELQGADLTEARLQGANLSFAELQGADMTWAKLQGANLSFAELQGADLNSAQLRGADLSEAKIWLARPPDDPADQSPAPIGLAGLDTSPLTNEVKAALKVSLQTNITNHNVLQEVMERLDPLLRDDPPKWTDNERWRRYISDAQDPPIDEVVDFLVSLACNDPGGHIARALAQRAELDSEGPVLSRMQGPHTKPLATALLYAKCKSANALTSEVRKKLRDIISIRQW
jgi:uncharacterized protein YjbI with pentapeptide repeats